MPALNSPGGLVYLLRIQKYVIFSFFVKKSKKILIIFVLPI